MLFFIARSLSTIDSHVHSHLFMFIMFTLKVPYFEGTECLFVLVLLHC